MGWDGMDAMSCTMHAQASMQCKDKAPDMKLDSVVKKIM